MIEITKAAAGAERELAEALRRRKGAVNEKISQTVAAIMADVRENGYQAVKKYSLELDGAEPRELSRAELEAARDRCDAKLVAAMERSAANIRAYQEKLLPQTKVWETEAGTLGQLVRGLTRVGVYVPGGAAAYPSSLLMTAVPARVAGVEEIVLVTPPTKNLSDAVMAAALIAGVDRVIAVGGAQAVAALTYGAGFIPRVDKLVGPGNAFVAAAKRMAFGELDIDMVAGPSEVLVIADGTANPVWAAADLLSQAEHDPLAAAVLVTDSEPFARAVAEELGDHRALPHGLRGSHRLRGPGAGRGYGQRDRPGAPGNSDGGAGKAAAEDQKRRGHLPGPEQPGAPGGLYGGPQPRPAHLRHRPLLLPTVRGQLFEADEPHFL